MAKLVGVVPSVVRGHGVYNQNASDLSFVSRSTLAPWKLKQAETMLDGLIAPRIDYVILFFVNRNMTKANRPWLNVAEGKDRQDLGQIVASIPGRTQLYIKPCR